MIMFEAGNGDSHNSFVADSGIISYVVLELGIINIKLCIGLKLRHNTRAYILLWKAPPKVFQSTYAPNQLAPPPVFHLNFVCSFISLY